MSLFCLFCLFFVLGFSFPASDISINIYNNTILQGPPANSVSLTSLNYSIPYNGNPLSAQVLGSILWDPSVDVYYITCDFDSTLFGFVWIDDHCICTPNVYAAPVFAFWNLSWSRSAYTTRKSYIRMDIYSHTTNISKSVNAVTSLHFGLYWSFNNNQSNYILNNTYLSSDIPSTQQQRMILQNNLTFNTFAPWFYLNMLTMVRMPDSFGMTFGVCDGSNTSKCITTDTVEQNNLWVGVHAYDHSYMEYNLSWNGYQLSYQYSSVVFNDTYSNFYAQIKLLSTNHDGYYPNKTTHKYHNDAAQEMPYIDFSSRFYWMRSGSISEIKTSSGDMNCFLNINGFGLSQSFKICSNLNTYTKREDDYLFQFNNVNDTIYFTTDTSITSSNDISSIINKLMISEYSTYTKYNNLSISKMGIQSGLMWNLVYSPEEAGPFNPVSRTWSHGNDFAMVIFDWDNIFASYQLSLDALDLAISNLLQVIKSKTVHGFVPNYKWVRGNEELSSSTDRTEPPIGSMVLYKMYKKYGNQITWLIQLLFDDLYDWVDWFWRRRRCEPKQLICLGSDPNKPDINNGENNMQAARYESGLDNSPMYDGNFFNTTSHHMMLYDVGMTGMFINEVKRLIVLGKAINVSSDVLNTLNERYDFMVNATLNELWDSTNNIFVNKFSQNDTFYFHISPTSFYPLMSGEPTVKQAEMMVTNYLLSSDYFCISKTFPTNQSEDCYYGLPSISHNDPAFKSQNYWRGLTWGPMAQLTWWSLDEYVEQSDIVKNGQQYFMTQMNALMLHIWNDKRHICENYSPSKNVGDCTGDHFYHWGGLSGFISLIHDYY